MSETPEGFSAKVREDALTWARSWKRKLTIGLWIRLFLLEPGFQLAFAVRLQEVVGGIPKAGVFLRRLVWFATCWRFSCDISPDAKIGGGIRFAHPFAIVIGGDSRIGRNVLILQSVTLGRRGDSPAFPTIEEGAVVNAGAVVAGGLTIGAAAMVGANAVVLADVPPGWSAVGVPARNIPPKGQRRARDVGDGKQKAIAQAPVSDKEISASLKPPEALHGASTKTGDFR